MSKEKDKVVSQIFETFDYDKFSIIPENRGQKDVKGIRGIKERKIDTLQAMIDDGTWIHEMCRVKVNKEFEIVDGAHTYELLKRNKMPIRYEIITDPHFNEVSKREMVGAIASVNSVTTSWSSGEFFKSAVDLKFPLALLMKVHIEDHDNYFLWTDLMGLLKKDSDFFLGRWRKINMDVFDDKELINEFKDQSFAWELKHFAKFNFKARIAPRKGIVLKAAYDIIWHARDMVEPTLFRKSLASIPENLVTSNRTRSEEDCTKLLINHYNTSQGQKLKADAVLYSIYHKVNGTDKAEPVLRIA